MPTCEYCEREFKNMSGLSGHKQLAHRLETGSQSADSSATERFNKRLTDRLEQTLEQLDQVLEQQLELAVRVSKSDSNPPLAQAEERILAALGNLEQQVQSFQQRELPRERQLAISEMLEIPGVRDAVDYNHWALERNKAIPNDPVPLSWHDAPGIKDAIEHFELRETPIEIIDDRESVDSNQPSGEDLLDQVLSGWAHGPITGVDYWARARAEQRKIDPWHHH